MPDILHKVGIKSSPPDDVYKALATVEGLSYNKLRNRKFKPLRDAGPREARELVEAGVKVFNNHKSKHEIDADK